MGTINLLKGKYSGLGCCSLQTPPPCLQDVIVDVNLWGDIPTVISAEYTLDLVLKLLDITLAGRLYYEALKCFFDTSIFPI